MHMYVIRLKGKIFGVSSSLHYTPVDTSGFVEINALCAGRKTIEANERAKKTFNINSPLSRQ